MCKFCLLIKLAKPTKKRKSRQISQQLLEGGRAWVKRPEKLECQMFRKDLLKSHNITNILETQKDSGSKATRLWIWLTSKRQSFCFWIIQTLMYPWCEYSRNVCIWKLLPVGVRYKIKVWNWKLHCSQSREALQG